MDEIGLGSLLASTLRMSTPLILAALAGTISERSGVIDLGLEGKNQFAGLIGVGSQSDHLDACVRRQRLDDRAPGQRRIVDHQNANPRDAGVHDRRYTPWLTASSPCSSPARLSE